MLIRDHLARATLQYPNNIAVLSDGEQCSYKKLNERSNRLANALRGLGLKLGDRVAVLMDNSIACIEIDCACAKAGLVRVSLNPRTNLRDAEFILRDSQAAALIFGERYESLVADLTQLPELTRYIALGESNSAIGGIPTDDYETVIAAGSDTELDVELDSESLHCLLYTSGTSGRPKGVMLSNRAIVQVAYNVLLELSPTTPMERILLLQPLSHGAAFYILPYFVRGCTIVLTQRTEPQHILEMMCALSVGAVKLVPTHLHNMLRVPGLNERSLPQLKRVIYGGSGIAVEVLRHAIEIFGTRLVQHYGQSEAPSTLTILPQSEHVAANIPSGILASAGRPWTTVEIVAVGQDGEPVNAGDTGEIIARGPHLMSGYWRNPELTAKVMRKGWVHTNDLGKLDDRGFIYLVGRKDEMIISGGFNIAPRDVEEVLYQHPAIHEAAVIGQPDPRWGQAVIAYVTLKSNVTPTEILAFSRPILGFKNPKHLYVVSELPKNPNGKIARNKLSPALAL